ncbi:hypothetical protein CNR22_00035 [Sphingobacteriaceae bacterium]|nr:hypothetical protein CNR22_00035 [Sphingobacteriaceae bacterium]
MVVTGTDASGCAKTAIVFVSVNSLPSLTITSSSSVMCASESTTLAANGALTFTCNTGENSASLTITPPVTTIYTLG